MTHEKIFSLSIGREAKIIVKGQPFKTNKEVLLELEFLIKDTSDRNFRLPIGTDHPQYWKLKKYTAEKCQYLQLEYSGISKREVMEAVKEFKQILGLKYNYRYKIPITERIKSLKGIRVTASNRRMLATV